MRPHLGAAFGASVISLLLLPVAVAANDIACTGSVTFESDVRGSEVHQWVATDPRLSGIVTIEDGWSFYATRSEDAGASMAVARYELVNPDGSWSCIASTPAGPEPDLDGHTLVFAGTGAYEGLTAHVSLDWSGSPYAFSGLITGEPVPTDPTLAG